MQEKVPLAVWRANCHFTTLTAPVAGSQEGEVSVEHDSPFFKGHTSKFSNRGQEDLHLPSGVKSAGD